jgi:hypothetical protein
MLPNISRTHAATWWHNLAADKAQLKQLTVATKFGVLNVMVKCILLWVQWTYFINKIIQHNFVTNQARYWFIHAYNIKYSIKFEQTFYTWAKTFCITTPSTTTFSITTLIKMNLFVTLSLNDIQHNNTQHKWSYWWHLVWMTFSITTLCLTIQLHYAECRYAACRYADCFGAIQNFLEYLIFCWSIKRYWTNNQHFP